MSLGFQTTSCKTRDRLAFPPPSPLPGKSKFNFWIQIVNSQDLSETGVQTDWRESWSPCSQRTHTFLGGKGDGPRNPVCCIETTAGGCDHLFLFNRLAKNTCMFSLHKCWHFQGLAVHKLPLSNLGSQRTSGARPPQQDCPRWWRCQPVK